ncbi:hypothetical protein OHU45_21985 [Streptomyces tubercidicus]|uniref:hypothetical protein n=1 Tax=Streptomyces tubercidicus TaxID=47759 RepID=UPI0032527918
MADRYRQYIDGDPFYALVGELNTAGHQTTHSGLWSAQTLIHYMDSGFCAALLRIHNPQCNCPSEVRGNSRNTLFIPGSQENLIGDELWQLYRERRQAVRTTPPRARRATYILTGLGRCGGCRGTTPANSAIRKIDGEDRNIPGYSYSCGRRGVTATHGCGGMWIKREDAEAEVVKWLTKEAAGGIDAAPPAPTQPAAKDDPRALAARARARLQAELDKFDAALVNLRTQRAMDPEEFQPGEYEAARDRIRKQQASTKSALEAVAAVETTPHRADYKALIVGTIDEWPTLLVKEKNALLKQLVRRVVFTREADGVAVQVHPVWEPDPWPPEEK